MKAKTFKGHNIDELKKGFEEAIADGFNPTLSIVFISIKQDREAICSLLDEHNIAIFGATTSGEFIDADLEEGSAVIMLLDLNPSYFKILLQEIGSATTREISKQVGTMALGIFKHPAFIVASGGI